MKVNYFPILVLASCLSSCIKDGPASHAVTKASSSFASTKTAAAGKLLSSAESDGETNFISISYDSVGNSLTILYDPIVSPYGITVVSGSKGTLYSNATQTSNSIVINTHLQIGDIITVTVTDNGGMQIASYYLSGTGGVPTATPATGPFNINVTSNLAYTQVNVTWTYTGGNPYTAGNYYIYFQSYCPSRNVVYRNIRTVSAGASTFTYTWDRPYTTYDSAYITILIEGVPITTNDPTAHFGDNSGLGSYVYLGNLLIPQTYSGNFQASLWPWVVHSYDGCNGPCVVQP